MTENELIAAVALDTGLPRTTVRLMLKSTGEHIAAVLRHGNEVTLPELGKLKPSARAERQGRNPKTGEVLTIPARHSVKFLPGKRLRDLLNMPD